MLAPWMGLTVKQIQDIVDRVFGIGVHKVTPESAWVGLISYRLSDWRSGIATQALKASEALINNYEADNDEDIEEQVSASATAPDSDAAAADALPTTEDTNAVENDPSPKAKVLKFTFDTPEGIKAFVEWALQPHRESETTAFHCKTYMNWIAAFEYWVQSSLITGNFLSVKVPWIGAAKLAI
ncbi:hypothetical protein B0H11DRAFT_2264793 [Mycena galericulata]|nr:hypothetical protein B0H11DRAFT_2264793 [Mycena galericulata]